MSTITKQWLQQTIAEMEEHRDLFPGDLDDSHENVLAALRIALASLEAEAVAFVMAEDLKDSSIISTPAYRDLGEAMERTVGDVVDLYAAPPAPVSVTDYPDVLPCPVMLEPGLRFGKGVPTRTMLGALQRRAEYYAELEAMTPEQRAEHDAGMKEFAAMFQGSEPVTTDYKLPDGWVACSERMPETYVNVLLTDEAEDTCIGQLECEDDDHFCINSSKQRYKATHWMQLPAAPQQEVKS